MINNEIKSEVVDLISKEHKGVDRITLAEAIKLAEQTDEDVICINSKSEIPVVKIGNYEKFLYEKEKKAKENKKKARQKSQVLKEIKMGDSIAEHDMKIKAKNVSRILKEGNKVSLVITYKGRGMRLIGQGADKLYKVIEFVDTEFKIDSEPKIDGNKVYMVISPKK